MVLHLVLKGAIPIPPLVLLCRPNALQMCHKARLRQLGYRKQLCGGLSAMAAMAVHQARIRVGPL